MSKLIKPQIGFTTLPNHIINDKRLSFKAKGLFLYLISKPDGWSFSSDRISNDCNDGIKSVKTGLIELENMRLLTRLSIREKGVFKGYDYVLSFDFSPLAQNGTTVSPSAPFASTEKPSADNGLSYKERDSKKDIGEEREITFCDFENSDSYPIVCFTFIIEFLNFVSKSAKNSLAYRSKLRYSLLHRSDKKHQQTFDAYNDFCFSRPDLYQNGALPVGTNIFDLIGRD